MKSLVIKTTSTAYILEDGSKAVLKGNFRTKGIRSTNPVAVGDYVEVTPAPVAGSLSPVAGSLSPVAGSLSPVAGSLSPVASSQTKYWITDIYDRKNYIVRKSTNLSKESHILAANVDQVMLLVTIKHPQTSTTFIDRFLATCEAYRVPAILVFNKIDLLNEEELAYLNQLRDLYESLGYPTLAISACCLSPVAGSLSPVACRLSPVASSLSPVACRLSPVAGSLSPVAGSLSPVAGSLSPVAGIREALNGKVTLFSGNSGVGKSTLINALMGEDVTRVQDISQAHDTGMHTTTFSCMYSIPLNSKLSTLNSHERTLVIDTPGIKGFGTFDMQRSEVSHYFREIFRIGRDCRFSDCLHLPGTPGCAVIEAVNTKIAYSRYESYVSLLGDSNESKYR